LASPEGSADLQQFLVTTPEKFDALGRSASYGSWLNFYQCEATVTGRGQHYESPNSRCKS
jgi:phospholipid/cholesterol/gamma-HCH transport system substrate-binding protein